MHVPLTDAATGPIGDPSPPGVQTGSKGNRGGARPNSGPKRKEPPPEKINKTARAPKGPLVLPELPKGRNAKLADLVKWWSELTPDQYSHLSVYVYRNWPMVDLKKYDPTAVTNIHLFSACPCPFTTDQWERDMLAMFGSGDYNFKINEDNTNRWVIYAKGLRDMDNYPPLIDDNLLMMNEPSNKDYILWARNRGRLTNIQGGESENDMANNEALSRLAATTDRLTDRVIDMAERATERREPDSLDTSAQLRGMELVQKAGEQALDVMRESINRNGAASDPLALVSKVVELTGAMNRDRGEDKLTPVFLAQIASAERRAEVAMEETRELRNLIMEDRRRRDDDREDKDPFAALKQLKEMKEVFGDMFGIKPPAAAEDGEGDSGSSKGKSNSLMQMIVEQGVKNLPAILTGATSLATTLVNGYLLTRNPQAPQVPTAQQTPGQPQPPQPPQQQILTQQLPLPAPTAPDPITEFAAAISPAFLHHLNSENLNGATFAGWLIDSRSDGRLQYDRMKEAGAEQILALLQMYPPLWSQVSVIPAKLATFVTEFLAYDEQQDDEEDEPLKPAA